MAAVYPFTRVIVWDQHGTGVKLAKNVTLTVTDPATGLPAPNLTVGGQPATNVTSDNTGHVDFSAGLTTVRLTAPSSFYQDVTSQLALSEAASGGGAIAYDTDNIPYLTDAPPPGGWADASIASAINSPISDTRGALNTVGDARWAAKPEGVGVTSTIYVSPGGSDAAPGTQAQPKQTLNGAFALLTTKGPILRGTWVIELVAGTYAAGDLPQTLTAENTVTIKGPAAGHPNVPTAIISGGYNIGDVGLDARNLAFPLIVQDILFSGYNGTTSSAGILTSATRHSLFTVNAHFTDCYWGISTQSAPYDVKGGKFLRCGYLGDTPNTDPPAGRNGNGAGCRSLMQSRHSLGLQGAGVLTNGPIFSLNRTGLFAQENSTGHSDWVTYEDNETAVFLGASSRANCDGSSFKRNGKAIRAILNSNAYVTTGTTFGTGVDENTAGVLMASGSEVIDDNRFFTTLSSVNGASLRNLQSKFPGTVVQTTSATIVDTLTLAGGMWRDVPVSINPIKRITLQVVGELAGTAGTKVLNIRLGTAVVGVTFTATEEGVFVADCDVYFNTQTAQQMILRGYRHLGTAQRLSRAVGSNALTANTALTVEALVGVATDSITVHSIDYAVGG